MHSGNYKDAFDLVTQRATKKSCPFCSKQDWQLIETADGVFITTPAQPDQVGASVETQVPSKPGGDFAVLPALAFACKNCGFLRVHVHDFEQPSVLDE
jgi:hypothetical protein